MTIVMVSLLAIGVMIYVGYHMVKSFTSEVEVQPAYMDTFSESVTLDAYVLRRERIISAGADGTVNYLVRDGEKVSVGAELADICRGGSAGIRERISAIDDTIKALSAIEASAAYSSTSDATNIETRIRELLYSVSSGVAGNDMLSALAKAEELRAQLNRHAIVTGKINGFGDQIEALKAERAGLVSQLTDVVRTVRSEESAYFFYDVDGYEAAFSFENVDDLSLDDIYAMTEAEAVMPGSDDVGKLVLDYSWYIAVPTDIASTLYFDEGSEYDVVFNAAGKTLRMRLRSILTDTGGESGRAAMIFECSSLPADFEYTRMQPVTVTVSTYTGYRVPLSAVRVVDVDGVEVRGVYILYGNFVYFRRVEIILTQDGYALCDSTAGEADDDVYHDFEHGGSVPAETEPPAAYEKIPYLSLYDMVITSARGLYDGKIVSG